MLKRPLPRILAKEAGTFRNSSFLKAGNGNHTLHPTGQHHLHSASAILWEMGLARAWWLRCDSDESKELACDGNHPTVPGENMADVQTAEVISVTQLIHRYIVSLSCKSLLQAKSPIICSTDPGKNGVGKSLLHSLESILEETHNGQRRHKEDECAGIQGPSWARNPAGPSGRAGI